MLLYPEQVLLYPEQVLLCTLSRASATLSRESATLSRASATKHVFASLAVMQSVGDEVSSKVRDDSILFSLH